MRKIIELDTRTDKYPVLTLSSGPTKDTIMVQIGKSKVEVDVLELMDSLVHFEPNGE